MASFKLCISDPSSGRTFQKEVKDNMARPFVGLNIGEAIKGDNFELGGYEFQITGGSDYCGFPMRSGILGQRKKITIYGGVGFRGAEKGIQRRKTVCGHKIHDNISQINLKVLKAGAKKLTEVFGVPEGKQEEKAEAKPAAKAGNSEEKEAKPAKSTKIEDFRDTKNQSNGERGEPRMSQDLLVEEKKEAKEAKPEAKKEHKGQKTEDKPEAKHTAEQKKE